MTMSYVELSTQNGTRSVSNTSINSTEMHKLDGDLTYTLLTTVVSCLSIIGGIGITAIYIWFRELRTPGRKLLVYLSVMDALTAFGNILGVIWLLRSDSSVIHKSLGYCKFQSALTIYSSISSFSWTVIMGVCLLFSIVRSNPRFTLTYMKLFHIISWGLPGFVVIVALSVDVLGYDQALDQASWCWIDPRVPYALFWQFFTGKFWEITTYLSTIILYTTVRVYIWNMSRKSIVRFKKKSRKAVQDANRKLMFVPLVFIIFRVWGTLRFLLGFFAHDYANSPQGTWIVPLQGIGDSAQGFANFVLYCCLTEKIRERLLVACCMRSIHVESDKTTMVSRVLKKSKVDVSKLDDSSVNTHVLKAQKMISVDVSQINDTSIEQVDSDNPTVTSSAVEKTIVDVYKLDDSSVQHVDSKNTLMVSGDQKKTTVDIYKLEDSSLQEPTTSEA